MSLQELTTIQPQDFPSSIACIPQKNYLEKLAAYNAEELQLNFAVIYPDQGSLLAYKEGRANEANIIYYKVIYVAFLYEVQGQTGTEYRGWSTEAMVDDKEIGKSDGSSYYGNYWLANGGVPNALSIIKQSNYRGTLNPNAQKNTKWIGKFLSIVGDAFIFVNSLGIKILAKVVHEAKDPTTQIITDVVDSAGQVATEVADQAKNVIDNFFDWKTLGLTAGTLGLVGIGGILAIVVVSKTL